MITDYEMTPEQLDTLKKAYTPTPIMSFGNVHVGASAQENLDRAWIRLGEDLGFDPMTAEFTGDDQRFFSAKERT